MKKQVIAEIKVVPLGTATISLSHYIAACLDTELPRKGLSHRTILESTISR